MQHLQYSAELLAPLQGLSGLHTLTLSAEEDCDDLLVGAGFAEVCLQVVAQLTTLRELRLWCPSLYSGENLLHLTQLRELTRLQFGGPLNGRSNDICLGAKVGFKGVLHLLPAYIRAAFLQAGYQQGITVAFIEACQDCMERMRSFCIFVEGR